MLQSYGDWINKPGVNQMTTYTVHEYGRNWIVRDESGLEVTRYRKDDVIGYDGQCDITEFKRNIRSDLQLKRSDRIVVED